MNWPPKSGSYLMDKDFNLWRVKGAATPHEEINIRRYRLVKVTGKRGRPKTRILTVYLTNRYFKPTKLHLVFAGLDHLDISP